LRVERILGEAQSMDDLGPRFTDDLTGAEVHYLVENEWAETAEDVLWRRSKLGLKASPDDRIAINQFIASLGTKAAS
jgi:glycerol-3-phosphate dehydrogenase